MLCRNKNAQKIILRIISVDMAQDRLSRVNELFRNILARHVAETLGLKPNEFITITRIETSRDLAHAKVTVTCFPDDKKSVLLDRLRSHANALRYVLAHYTTMQKVPHLSFFEDRGEEQANYMNQLLDSL